MSATKWYGLRDMGGRGTCLVPVELLWVDGRRHHVRYADGVETTLDRDYVTSTTEPEE